MQKIPTLFLRDPATNRRTLLREVHPDCQWVIDGEGEPTRKFDGTAFMLDPDGRWWARREVKAGKQPPDGFVAIETDAETGKTVGWEPWGQSPFARYLQDAIAAMNLLVQRHDERAHGFRPGTYELCGPKVNGNPERYTGHVLIYHADADLLIDAPTDYDGLAKYLADLPHEGIVWHHPDGRMAKIKRKDFPRETR